MNNEHELLITLIDVLHESKNAIQNKVHVKTALGYLKKCIKLIGE